MRVLLAAFFGAAILGIGFLFVKSEFLNPAYPEANTTMFFEVLPGTSLRTISDELQKNSIIKNADAFFWYGRLTKKSEKIKAGEYEVSAAFSADKLYEILQSGKSIGKPFTISEGLNMFEIAERFQKAGFGTAEDFLKITRDPKLASQLTGENLTSLEGYLFPETYHITRGTSALSFIRTTVETFNKNFSQAVPTLPEGWNRHKIVTLASIIEKETGAEFERPTISAVFHNRLNKKMRLQTDPTIIYGIALKTGSMPLNIRKSDLLADEPYNTYRIPALPPGPIANPGAEALKAAIAPDDSEYLFFVSQNDGTHIFSKTYAEHNEAVNKYQRDPNARKGKSWRQLNEKQTGN